MGWPGRFGIKYQLFDSVYMCKIVSPEGFLRYSVTSMWDDSNWLWKHTCREQGNIWGILSSYLLLTGTGWWGGTSPMRIDIVTSLHLAVVAGSSIYPWESCRWRASENEIPLTDTGSVFEVSLWGVNGEVATPPREEVRLWQKGVERKTIDCRCLPGTVPGRSVEIPEDSVFSPGILGEWFVDTWRYLHGRFITLPSSYATCRGQDRMKWKKVPRTKRGKKKTKATRRWKAMEKMTNLL